MKIMQPQCHYKIMENFSNLNSYENSRNYLKEHVQVASFGGLFLTLSSTLFVWVGSVTFDCPPIIWKVSLLASMFLFFLTWAVYFPFRNTNKLVCHGIISLLIIVSLFFLFGYSMFYFYFLFAPLKLGLRFLALIGMTSLLVYRAKLISSEIKKAFEIDKNLFQKIYVDEGIAITHSRKSFELIKKLRKERNPFKSFYLYTALTVGPFIFIWNRITAPSLGDGHGVFLILAFFSVPILLWGIESLVQIIFITIYYPIKLEREIGKPVLIKDW